MSERSLERHISTFDAAMLIVGAVIGSGIFLVPASIAARATNPPWFLSVWIGAGILTLLGALTYAELGTRVPETGGMYVFIRKAFGDLAGYLYGWTLLLVIQTGAVAALSSAFSIYLAYFLPLGSVLRKIVAVVVVLLLSSINCVGIRLGTGVQNFLTVAKIATLAALCIFGFAMPGGSASHFAGTGGTPSLQSLGVATLAALFAYEGWQFITFTLGEMKAPEKTGPRALAIGCGIIILVYLVLNAAYLYRLPIGRLATSERVSADVAELIFGKAGGSFVAASILIAALSSINANILMGSRVYFALARDGLFFKSIGRLHPRFGTPIHSIALQAAWSCLLVLTGTFQELFLFATFGAWIFHSLTAASLFRFRAKDTGASSGPIFRVPGYPLPPVLFILVAISIVAGTLISDPIRSLAGVGIIGSGVPVYFLWKRRL